MTIGEVLQGALLLLGTGALVGLFRTVLGMGRG